MKLTYILGNTIKFLRSEKSTSVTGLAATTKSVLKVNFPNIFLLKDWFFGRKKRIR